MKTRRMIMIILVGMIVMAGCGTDEDWGIPGQPTLPPPTAIIEGQQQYAFQSYLTEDEQIRYILTDFQLGRFSAYNPVIFNSYDYSVFQKAFELWSLEVRVVNINRFYLSTKPEIISIGSLPVVIVGLIFDYEIGGILDPRNVILTTDLQPTLWIPSPSIVPENTLAPTIVGLEYLCENPWWPIAEGATWTYVDPSGSAANRVEMWEVTRISPGEGNRIDFTIQAEGFLDGSYSRTDYYYCDDTGIYSVHPDFSHLFLPIENNLEEGVQHDLGNEMIIIFEGFQNITTPAGNFYAVEYQISSEWGSVHYWFSQGVGIIQIANYGGGASSYLGLSEAILP